MKSYEHTHDATSMHAYMEALSDQLKAPIKNNSIQIPESIGTGFIKNLFIDEGFCLRYYHFTLNRDLVIKWNTGSETNEPIFRLIFFLEGVAKDQESGDLNKGSHLFETANSAILYSSDFNRIKIVNANRPVNRMVFLFTKKWLQENFNEASEKIIDIVNVLVKKSQPTLIIEDIDRSHYIFAHELAKEMKQDYFPLIHVKTKALILLNDFLNRIVSRGISNINIDQTLYYPEITKVESTLRQSYNRPMPSITELASDFNLSPSTLKRHFKIVYGKNIQTYYLANKMAVGKSLILSKSKTISEIAFELGYTKLNSFSKAFKKQYGILPKEVNNSCIIYNT
ncbi:MAG: AraC family transcriptional regulator [Ferruginibacter sp.]